LLLYFTLTDAHLTVTARSLKPKLKPHPAIQPF
jgi:multisubunit Na+/H+ antiporter MnhE subunit